MSDVLSSFTVYQSPRDCPGKFVVRRWVIRGGPAPVPTNDVVVCDTLDEAREFVPPGLICFPRSEGDDPTIVETWM
jgi:hypothetical protein